MKKYIRKIADYIGRSKNRYSIIEQIRRGLFLLLHRKRLGTKTKRDIELEVELRSNMQLISREEPDRQSPAENKWIRFKNAIRNNALENDPRDFLDWPEIRFNMQYIPSLKDLNTLKSDKNWGQIRIALTEKPNIRRKPYFALPQANENTIKQAFHFTTFLKETGIKLSSIERIVEFGGGYGSMCLYINNLGFSGKYIIFDWPELSMMQSYYLKSQDIPRSIDFGNTQTDISLVNSIVDIKTICSDQKKTLLIATWSLSECSLDLRDNFLNATKPDFFLIAYQKKFTGIDNDSYFAGLRQKMPEFEWKELQMDFIPTEKNKYLFGIKKNY